MSIARTSIHVSCENQGLDLFDHIHEQLQQRRHGTLELRSDGAPTIVNRVVRIVRDIDPTFRGVGPGSASVRAA